MKIKKSLTIFATLILVFSISSCKDKKDIDYSKNKEIPLIRFKEEGNLDKVLELRNRELGNLLIDNKEDSKLKYLTLIPNILALLFVFGIMQDEMTSRIIIFSVVKEKEYADMMDLISTIKNCKGYFVAPIGNGRALAVKDMATYLKKHVDVPVYESTSIREAFWMVTSKKKTEDVLFCTGSLYMVGEVKQAIFEHMDTHNGG